MLVVWLVGWCCVWLVISSSGGLIVWLWYEVCGFVVLVGGSCLFCFGVGLV